MTSSKPGRRLTRKEAVAGMVHYLERFGWPRVQMTLMVLLTGLAGFFASVLLRARGVDDMWLRYPLAVGIAYAVFLLLLWIWMHTGGPGEDSVDDAVDVGADLVEFSVRRAASASEPAGQTLGDSALEAVGGAAEGEGCVLVVAVVVVAVLAGGLLVAAGYVVSGAPLLLAELLVDGALSVGLYRRLRRDQQEFWLLTAVRHTGLVFVLAAGFLCLAGLVLANIAPGAHSIGEAIEGRKAHVEEYK